MTEPSTEAKLYKGRTMRLFEISHETIPDNWLIRTGTRDRGTLGEVFVVLGIPNLQGKQNDTYCVTLEMESVSDVFLAALDLISKAKVGEISRTVKNIPKYPYRGW